MHTVLTTLEPPRACLRFALTSSSRRKHKTDCKITHSPHSCHAQPPSHEQLMITIVPTWTCRFSSWPSTRCMTRTLLTAPGRRSRLLSAFFFRPPRLPAPSKPQQGRTRPDKAAVRGCRCWCPILTFMAHLRWCCRISGWCLHLCLRYSQLSTCARVATIRPHGLFPAGCLCGPPPHSQAPVPALVLPSLAPS